MGNAPDKAAGSQGLTERLLFAGSVLCFCLSLFAFFQYAAFYRVIDRLLSDERRPFTGRFVAFCNEAVFSLLRGRTLAVGSGVGRLVLVSSFLS